MSTLFDTLAPTQEANAQAPNACGAVRPLADRMRPERLEDVVGQAHLTGPEGSLRRMLESGRLSSFILWGPPGCGKTTLARILARESGLRFEQISAIFSGVADLKRIFDSARVRRSDGRGTLLFVDEIHRFNKSQQDAFLPVVEDGTIVLIGATTENPSFEINAALLSRCQVFVLHRLDDRAMDSLLQRAEDHAGRPLPLTAEARTTLKAMADGDGRYALSMAERLLGEVDVLDTPGLMRAVQRRAPLYDKANEGHYNLISALHKSVRGSDPDAALYWFSRMLEGGEDPRYIARRMTRMAVEDIGLAEPQALPVCLAAWEAFERMGSPEGDLALGQALVFLATAPKSNAVYRACGAARQSAKASGSLMPPAYILNAPTQLMKDVGYGAGYVYDPDTAEGFSGQNYFPEGLSRPEFYHPVERGFERDIRKRLDYWAKLRQEKAKP